MPATVITREKIAAGVTAEALERERKLRLKAGAIRVWVEATPLGGTDLCTEWNVIGDDDDGPLTVASPKPAAPGKIAASLPKADAAAAVAATTPAAADAGAKIAWGAKVGEPFKKRVVEVCTGLGCDPSFLMAAMAFETGERFTADVVNSTSGATGLIQFMPSTAKALGTTTAKLAKMTAVEQLDVVEAYFAPFKSRLGTLSDVYMAILWPAAVGRPESHELFSRPSAAYKQNSGLDVNKDGIVTKAEAAAKVFAKLTKGMTAGLAG
jgi:hypothetical protein